MIHVTGNLACSKNYLSFTIMLLILTLAAAGRLLLVDSILSHAHLECGSTWLTVKLLLNSAQVNLKLYEKDFKLIHRITKTGL